MTGKQLFDARLEYPLREVKNPKTKDYVFYFVPKTDEYGLGARDFLDKFYSKHESKEVSSIEELIGFLDAQITSGVEHIREVVIVAHANARGMQLKLLEAASATAHKEFRFVTFESIAILQQDFADGTFAAFKKKRERVIARMTDKSWVTIRACRFGSSEEGLYALFAFFGGRANVYAPRDWQFFGWQPIGPRMRFTRRLEAHEHLVRQRFYPKDIHTDDRKDIVVKFLAHPGRYSETVEIDRSSAPSSDPGYATLVKELDEGRIPDKVREKLAGADHELTPKAFVEILSKRRGWTIHDMTTHDGKELAVDYVIWEEPSTTDVSLKAAAKLGDTPAVNEGVPVQAFYDSDQNDTWRGKLFTLASYTSDPDATPPTDAAQQAALEAMVAELDSGTLAEGSAILTRFDDENQPLLRPATVTRDVAANGKGPWFVTGDEHYQIKLEHPMLDARVQGHMLTVLRHHLTKKAKLAAQYEVMAYLGENPDCPGPELAAYFDTIDTPGLITVIDHLRAPYREVNSYYIHHAQQALARKREYRVWAAEEQAALPNDVVLGDSPYLALSFGERSDFSNLFYRFDFNKQWAEVKMSFPGIPPVTTDLFAIEHSLWKQFRTGPVARDTHDVDAESPAFDLEGARKAEAEGNEKYFQDDKVAFEAAPSDKITCEDLAALIEKWKTLEGKTVEEVEKALTLAMGPKNKSLYQTLKDVKELYGIFRKLKKVTSAKGGLDSISKGWKVRLVEKIPWFAPSAIGVPSAVGVLVRVWGVWGIVSFPLTKMWKKFLVEQQHTLDAWKTTGKIVGVRRYLRELAAWPFSSDYPDNLTITLDPADVVRWYYREQIDIWGMYSTFVWAGDEEMVDGFAEGLALMKDVGPVLVKHAHDAIADGMREMGMDACMSKVLVDAGVLDLVDLHKTLIREVAWHMLDEVPTP